MRRQAWLAGALMTLLWAAPARTDTGVIVRTTNLSALQTLCALPATCTVVGNLDGTLNQVFLVTSPLPLSNILGLLNGVLGVVDVEVDQVLTLVGGLNLLPAPLDPTLMSDRAPVVYPAGSTTTAWNSYVNQPAAGIVEVQTAQSDFHVTGSGIVADIDTGVDPNHPVLQPVLLQGYDFIRNQPGASEMNDLSPSFPTPSCTTTCSKPTQVNQSSAAILDQSSAAILDTGQYSAFGHGTMVLGIIHLVAPTAQLLPLKAFKSDGTANLSDILRAIYYAVQQGHANIINMSFDTTTSSTELKNALDYANQLGLTCVASAGNDGAQETVYPAALQTDVMGVASVGSTSSTEGTRSSFSNYGNSIVWVAAPGEQIVTTYPWSSYAAGWGTSFSAPFVSGGAALLHALRTAITESESATALANGAPLTQSGMGNGRLDLVQALQAIAPRTDGDFDGDGKADVAVFRPSNGTWYVIPSSAPTTFTATQWGVRGDMPVRGDFDGDGKTDIGVWRPSSGTWYVIPSGTPTTFTATQWGVSGDVPVPGDYDGDGKTDMAVWRPSTGTWYVLPSSMPGTFIAVQWGLSGDIPVPGDYDGDGKTDMAVWRPSTGTWYVIPSSAPTTFVATQWGVTGDMPVPGDYDGDGKTDKAVWRPSTGTWYVIPSSAPATFTATQWGMNGDIPVPVDYDRDRKTDKAVWRPSTGTWYIIPSSAPTTFTSTQWGISTDAPVQKPIGQ